MPLAEVLLMLVVLPQVLLSVLFGLGLIYLLWRGPRSLQYPASPPG